MVENREEEVKKRMQSEMENIKNSLEEKMRIIEEQK